MISTFFVNQFANEMAENSLKRSAIVFSPHPDDETLSCGGTIIKKKKAGADVKVFFMTDGSKSHPNLSSPQELAQIRANEARNACGLLGLAASDVFFLNYRDGELDQNLDSATDDVLHILQVHQPEELFIPYCNEPKLWSLDHLSTNRVVRKALKLWKKKVAVYEYPTWLWYNHPLVWQSGGKQLLMALKNRITSRYYLLRDFRCSVCIKDVLSAKRLALSQYRSQLERLIPDPRWDTLGEVSDGKFLECFFQENEFFSVKEFGS